MGKFLFMGAGLMFELAAQYLLPDQPLTGYILAGVGVLMFLFGCVLWLHDKKMGRRKKQVSFKQVDPRLDYIPCKHPPDIKIKDAIEYIVNDSNIKLTANPQGFMGAEYEEVRKLIREYAIRGECHLHGKKQLSNHLGLIDSSRLPIKSDEWKTKELDIMAYVDTERYMQTRPISNEHKDEPQYTDIWMNKNEIQSIWRPKSWLRRYLDRNKSRIIYPNKKAAEEEAENQEFEGGFNEEQQKL